jgi:indolepyruvate ferredoxin oxidoreductase
MKTIQEVVESSATADINADRVKIVVPDFEMPPGGVHIRWPDAALDQEARLFDYKWYAALAYIRANRLNHNVIEGPNDRYGIMASGKAYNDTRQALVDLGLDTETCQRLGIRVHKVSVVWPLEAQSTREFAKDLKEILVVEEKRQIIEYQLKEELYNWPDSKRPRIVGKFDELEGDDSGGEWSVPNPMAHRLLRANADLTPTLIAKALARRLKKLDLPSDVLARIDALLQTIDAKERAQNSLVLNPSADRMPWFCSGCPHNTSTKVPEGSRAMAGIGCHFMSVWMDRSTVGFTQMGGEGTPWIGQQHFSNEKHVFANIGDGTYFHSGILAIRQSIAAGVNITYKILYNDAVAMTGGQRVGERAEGHSVVQIAQSMRAEGAMVIKVVTDEPEKYDGVALAEGVLVHHRDELDAVQRVLREVKGCTVIIYDQTCATEKRRRRKRGTMVDPAVRVMINELVCEGCGDCGVQSNCLSVEPLETEFGRKRAINQNTCNKDTSCLKGFCPSFISIEGGQLKKKNKEQKFSWDTLSTLPLPVVPDLGAAHQPYGVVVAGVGGTGVITIGQLLGMAAHLDGLGIVTQDSAGLAQKGGATWSHVLLAKHQDDIQTTRVSMAAADLILGCDPIVAAGKETLSRMMEGRTRVALNSHSAPTAEFVKNTQWQNPADSCAADIASTVGLHGLASFDADHLSAQLMGDTIYINPMLLGYAWQKGWVPLSLDALKRAIELNEVAVTQNLTAFEWGRHAAHQLPAVEALLKPLQIISFKKRDRLEDLIATRIEFLTAYQNAAYAKQYENFVLKVKAKESPLGSSLLTETVARQLFRLMAYKDEYEVARLHTDKQFLERVKSQFEGDFKVFYHLAPPLIAKRNEKGQLIKQKMSPHMVLVFKVLAQFKFLRGTALDIFGRTEERQTERALIQEYKDAMDEVLVSLKTENHALAVKMANVTEQIKGFGHVKEKHLAAVMVQWQNCMDVFRKAI